MLSNILQSVMKYIIVDLLAFKSKKSNDKEI